MPRVLQIGNFEPAHSTENDLRWALERLGVEVVALQEQDVLGWWKALDVIRDGVVDMVLWTSTYGLAERVQDEVQFKLLDLARRVSVPTVGYHLDRWWGLRDARRQEQLARPFFSCSQMFTADGGHDDMWPTIGVKHTWMPPAISERWCYLAEPKPGYECDIVFVGGWENYGHTEWTHRHEMIRKVTDWYGDGFLCLPVRGQPRITQGELNHVYASAKVVLGDSCLAPTVDGKPITRYCSDRIPETTGRGGVLLHPRVEGINSDENDPFYYASRVWNLDDWDDLRVSIQGALEDAADNDYWTHTRQFLIDNIKGAHTYTHRMAAVLLRVLGWSPDLDIVQVP